MTSQRHHQSNGMLCCGYGIARRRINHGDAAPCCRFYIHIVNTNTGAGDNLQLFPRLYDIGGNLGLTAHHHCIIIPDDRYQFLRGYFCPGIHPGMVI